MKQNEDFTYLEHATDEELLRFVGQIETAGLLMAPKNLKEQVLRQVAEEETKQSVQIRKHTQVISKQTKTVKPQGVQKPKTKHNKRAELILYSIKITSAVAAAIFFISISNPQASNTMAAERTTQAFNTQETKVQQLTSYLNSATNELCVGLNRFSANIMRKDWERGEYIEKIKEVREQ